MLIRKDGFTLIEILTSIVLISIIAIFIFPVFSNIFSSIFSSGAKTQSIFSLQDDIITEINNKTDSLKPNEIISLGSIQFIGELRNVSIPYQLPNSNKDQNVEIDYYIYISGTPSP